MGCEAAQACRWGLPSSAAGLGELGAPHPSFCLDEGNILTAGRQGLLAPSPLGEAHPPPHLHPTHSCCPQGHAYWEPKPKHNSPVLRAPAALLGPSKALCYPLWSRIRLFAGYCGPPVNKLESRQEKSHSDPDCWTSSKQALSSPVPTLGFCAPVCLKGILHIPCTHQQTTDPKHKPKHAHLYSSAKMAFVQICICEDLRPKTCIFTHV